MKGIWLEKKRLTLRKNIEKPTPLPHEALIRVKKAGICATDLAMVSGYYPFTGIIGHEFVGEVVCCQKRPELEKKRIAGEINIPCGNCSICKTGQPRHCKNRNVLGIKNKNGAFAQYLTLPSENLLALPDEITDESALFIEPLAAALRVLEQVSIGPAQTVLIIGAGRLGQLLARAIKPTGCTLTVSAKYPRQKALLSADRISTLSPKELNPPFYNDRRFDVVLEATGSPEGFTIARKITRPNGTLVLKSTYKGKAAVDLSSIAVDELTIIGSRCGPFLPAIEFLIKNDFPSKDLIDKTFSLNDGLKAFELAGAKGVLKVVIDMTI